MTNCNHTRCGFILTICLCTITNSKSKDIIYLARSWVDCIITTSNCLLSSSTIIRIINCTNSNCFTCTSNSFNTNTDTIFTSSIIFTTNCYVTFTVCNVGETTNKGTRSINFVFTTNYTCLVRISCNCITRTYCCRFFTINIIINTKCYSNILLSFICITYCYGR